MTNEERLLHALYGIKKVLNDFGLEDIKNEVQFKDGNSETIDCINVLQEFVVDYNSKWYWWNPIICDLLAEYGICDSEIIDKDIEIIAWMPLPESYKGKD